MGFEVSENTSTTFYRLNDLEKNSILKGIYKGSFTGGEFNSTTHYFVDMEGQKCGVSGCSDLDRKMSLIPEEAYVELTYKGKRKLETAKGVVQAHSFWVEQRNDEGALEPVIFRREDAEINTAAIEGDVPEGYRA